MQDLVDLANANMFQETFSTGKTDWEIRKNVTGDVLETLPRHLTDSDMFAIIKFARRFELIALNAGIEFEKRNSSDRINKIQERYEAEIIALSERNELLSDKLKKLMEQEEI